MEKVRRPFVEDCATLDAECLFLGRELPKIGPKPILLTGSGLMGLGLVLFLLNRSTPGYVALDMFVALGGVVAIIVPIVNMLTTSLPRESIAVGLGMNTLIRNLGGAIGPVVATSIMATYASPFVTKTNGQTIVGQLPSSTAFNLIFEIGIILVILVAALSVATKNYTFKKTSLTTPTSTSSGQAQGNRAD